MDRAERCPKCSYCNDMETAFDVCPRCGLIIYKYYQRYKELNTKIKTDIASSLLQPISTKNYKWYLLKLILFSGLLLTIITVAALFIYHYTNNNSGAIIWTQTSEGKFYAEAMAIDENFIYLVGGDAGLWRIEKRNKSDGALVSGFGAGGVITVKHGDRWNRATGVAVDTQYLYIAGNDSNPGTYGSQWRIEKRRLSDGSMVTGFGDGGFVTSQSSQLFADPKAIIIDSDYVYIAGNELLALALQNSPHYREDGQWRIEKRKVSDGSLVSEFGAGGAVTYNPNTVEGDGGTEAAHAIVITDDAMYVLGKAYNAAPYDTLWRIEKRRLSNGCYFEEFGNGGVVAHNPSPASNEAHGIALDEKHMYIVGHDMIPGISHSDFQWRIEKRNQSDGALVGEFGTNGVITSNPSNRVDWAHAIVLDRKPGLWKRALDLDLLGNKQAMYVIGKDETPGTRDQQWRIEKRRCNNGSLVNTFGNAGIVTINPSKGFESATAIAVDSDYIYVAGENDNLHSAQIVKIKK